MDHVNIAPDIPAAVDTLWTVLEQERAVAAVDLPYQALLLGNLHGRLSHETVDRRRDLAQWTDLPFREAITFFRAKRIITPTEFKRLDDSARRRAFTMAGLHQQHALTEAHSALTSAIAEGVPKRAVEARLREAMASAGVTGASRHYVDTAFRTNVLGAYSEGHYAQAVKVRKTRPFWKYRTMGDGRVRPTHAAMNGLIYAADDPIWDTWYPKNGFSCRCSVSTLSAAEVDVGDVQTKLPSVGGKPAAPDRGWAGSPRMQGGAKRAEDKLLGAVRSRAVAQPPRLASKGAAVFADAGDLGKRTSGKLAGRLDAWAGVSPARARALAADGPFEIIPTTYRAPAGSTRFELAIPSVYADSMAQMVRRLALDPRTAQVATKAQFTHMVHYRAGAAVAEDASAVMGGGVTRHGTMVLSITTKDPQVVDALAELLADAEAGSGAAIRRAPEKAHLVILGAVDPAYGYVKAFRNTAPEGGKTRVVFSRQPLAKFKSEPVLLTERTVNDL